MADVVTHRTVPGHTIRPLVGPVIKPDRRADMYMCAPAELVHQPARNFHHQLAGVGNPDCFVPEPFPALTVSGQKHAGRVPLPAPLVNAEPGRVQVVTGP